MQQTKRPITNNTISQINPKVRSHALHKQYSQSNLHRQPISHLVGEHNYLAKAISPINRSVIQSEIGNERLIKSTSSHSVISNLGLSHVDSNVAKSRKNRIFLEPSNIQFKLPELSQYYYQKKNQMTQTLNNFGESNEDHKNNQSNNSFFDFINHTYKPESNQLGRNSVSSPNNFVLSHQNPTTITNQQSQPIIHEQSKEQFTSVPKNTNYRNNSVLIMLVALLISFMVIIVLKVIE